MMMTTCWILWMPVRSRGDAVDDGEDCAELQATMAPAAASATSRERFSDGPQLTTIWPVMPLWMVQRYAYVPAWVNLTSQVPPPACSEGSERLCALSKVTVWLTVPGLVHSTMSPTCAVCEAGSNFS